MHICYIDEAGCTGMLPSAVSDIQPVLAIGGIIVDQTRLKSLTLDFLDLKRRYFPGATLPGNRKPTTPMDWGLFEVKGADIRNMLSDYTRKPFAPRRSALSFLSDFIALLEKHHVRLLGKVLVKGITLQIKGMAIYTMALQEICHTFQNFLTSVKDEGFIIADSRNKEQNAQVSHSIFTQKFKFTGDEYGRILEMPTFGHSENHAGIQIADLLCSAFLFPMAVDAFCTGILTSCHCRGNDYRELRYRYGGTIMSLQHRYQSGGKWYGGIRIQNRLSTVTVGSLFRAI